MRYYAPSVLKPPAPTEADYAYRDPSQDDPSLRPQSPAFYTCAAPFYDKLREIELVHNWLHRRYATAPDRCIGALREIMAASVTPHEQRLELLRDFLYGLTRADEDAASDVAHSIALLQLSSSPSPSPSPSQPVRTHSFKATKATADAAYECLQSHFGALLNISRPRVDLEDGRGHVGAEAERPYAIDMSVRDVHQGAWLSHKTMEALLRSRLQPWQHERLVFELEMLSRNPLSASISAYLDDHHSVQTRSDNVKKARRPDEDGRAYGLGRRKSAVAQVWLTRRPAEPPLAPTAAPVFASTSSVSPAGRTVDQWDRTAATGSLRTSVQPADLLHYLAGGLPRGPRTQINEQPLSVHFRRIFDRDQALMPLLLANRLHAYDVTARVHGGGLSAQAQAIRLGVARALIVFEPSLEELLQQRGLLTRDERTSEPKKPGRRKARRRFQWVKR